MKPYFENITGCEQSLLSYADSMEAVDLYAMPNLPNSVMTNMTELLKNDEKERLLHTFTSDEKYNTMLRSDYEWFLAFSHLSEKLCGTKSAEIFEEELRILIGNEGICLRHVKESDWTSIWRDGNRNLSETQGNYSNFLKKYRVEFLQNKQALLPRFDRVKKYNKKDGSPHYFLDGRGLRFQRPDPYHAKLATERLARGECLSSEEESMLFCQLIYQILSESVSPISLHVRWDYQGREFDALISYLQRFDVVTDVWLSLDDDTDGDCFAELCAKSDAKRRIRGEIVLGVCDASYHLYARLCRLAARYPISALRFGGTDSKSPLFFAEHRHFIRVLARVLDEAIPCAEERLAIGRTILLSALYDSNDGR